MSTISPASVKRRKFVPLLLGMTAAGLLLAAFSVVGVQSGFTASINNTNNSVASGTLLMTETQGATTCLSSAAGTVTVANAGTCGTINKFGGATAAVPGTVYTSTVTIQNNGTVPASAFTLTPSGCAQANNGTVNGTATDFCAKVNVTIEENGGTAKCVFPATAGACAAPSSTNTLASMGSTPINLTVPVAPGASRTYTFKVQIDNSATNAHQGLVASEALLWAFAS